MPTRDVSGALCAERNSNNQTPRPPYPLKKDPPRRWSVSKSFIQVSTHLIYLQESYLKVGVFVKFCQGVSLLKTEFFEWKTVASV